jgi:hypothetical protein
VIVIFFEHIKHARFAFMSVKTLLVLCSTTGSLLFCQFHQGASSFSMFLVLTLNLVIGFLFAEPPGDQIQSTKVDGGKRWRVQENERFDTSARTRTSSA